VLYGAATEISITGFAALETAGVPATEMSIWTAEHGLESAEVLHAAYDILSGLN
jgi:hypothetical protein